MSTDVNPIEETTAVLNGVPAAEIRAQLDLILRSRAFIQSHRIRRFLQFVVEESLLGQPHRLKEYLIGLEVFDRREAFDPRVDSIVRVEARRLRYKLEEYYRTEGREDGIRIVLRKGSYVPIFEYRTRDQRGQSALATAQHGDWAFFSDQRDLGNGRGGSGRRGRRDSAAIGARTHQGRLLPGAGGQVAGARPVLTSWQHGPGQHG